MKRERMGLVTASFFLAATIQGSVLLPLSQAQETESVRKPARPLPAERSAILFRDERQTTEPPNLVMDAMGLENGDIVADIGCGPGYYSLPLAERISPHGVVFAVDIQQGMLDQLAQRMKEAGVTPLESIDMRMRWRPLPALSTSSRLRVARLAPPRLPARDDALPDVRGQRRVVATLAPPSPVNTKVTFLFSFNL